MSEVFTCIFGAVVGWHFHKAFIVWRFNRRMDAAENRLGEKPEAGER